MCIFISLKVLHFAAMAEGAFTGETFRLSMCNYRRYGAFSLAHINIGGKKQQQQQKIRQTVGTMDKDEKDMPKMSKYYNSEVYKTSTNKIKK